MLLVSVGCLGGLISELHAEAAEGEHDEDSDLLFCEDERSDAWNAPSSTLGEQTGEHNACSASALCSGVSARRESVSSTPEAIR